jgi:hypothetical protein
MNLIIHCAQIKRKHDSAAGRPATYLALPLVASAISSQSVLEVYHFLCNLVISEYLFLKHAYERELT